MYAAVIYMNRIINMHIFGFVCNSFSHDSIQSLMYLDPSDSFTVAFLVLLIPEQTFPLTSPQHHRPPTCPTLPSFDSVFNKLPAGSEVNIFSIFQRRPRNRRSTVCKNLQNLLRTFERKLSREPHNNNNIALSHKWSESTTSPNSAFPPLPLTELSAVIDEVTLTLCFSLKASLPFLAVGNFPSAFLCLSATFFDSPLASFDCGVTFFFVRHFIFPSPPGWRRFLPHIPLFPLISSLVSVEGDISLSLYAPLSYSLMTALGVFLLI